MIPPGELEMAIGGLSHAQQAVIRLRYYGGLSFREIGNSLGISLNTAASRCRYALDALCAVFFKKGIRRIKMENQTNANEVKFSGGAASVAGVFGGVAIAIGVLWAVLPYAQALGDTILTIVVLTGVIGGVLISLTSAFFGLVMPHSVGGNWHEHERGGRHSNKAGNAAGN